MECTYRVLSCLARWQQRLLAAVNRDNAQSCLVGHVMLIGQRLQRLSVRQLVLVLCLDLGLCRVMKRLSASVHGMDLEVLACMDPRCTMNLRAELLPASAGCCAAWQCSCSSARSERDHCAGVSGLWATDRECALHLQAGHVASASLLLHAESGFVRRPTCEMRSMVS